jgi:hypothetical protein
VTDDLNGHAISTLRGGSGWKGWRDAPTLLLKRPPAVRPLHRMRVRCSIAMLPCAPRSPRRAPASVLIEVLAVPRQNRVDPRFLVTAVVPANCVRRHRHSVAAAALTPQAVYALNRPEKASDE